MDKKYHFVGVGGIGMSGLARLLLLRQHAVSGSDLQESLLTEELARLGAKVYVGHKAKNVPQDAAVVVTSQLDVQNEELVIAQARSQPLLHRSELLHRLMEGKQPLLVTGSHGKTTTSALLTAVLRHAGEEPTYAIGGILQETKSNAGVGQGEYFVAEADESDGSFLRYAPYAAIITNIDNDHLDYYQSMEALTQAFAQFADKVQDPSLLFRYQGDSRLAAFPGVGYGFCEKAYVRGTHVRQEGWHLVMDISIGRELYRDVRIAVVGQHNAANALAVFGLARRLGVAEEKIREAFLRFSGVQRRVERRGEEQGMLFLDDYGHHPTEIAATLDALKRAEPYRRLVVFFQPHRYSRTALCYDQFATALQGADLCFITDVYAAGESPPLEQLDLQKMVPSAHYLPKKGCIEQIHAYLRPFDLVITLGAGDITYLGWELIEKVRREPVPRWSTGLVFGGESLEHPISWRSAQLIAQGLDPQLFDVRYFAISQEGLWTVGDETLLTGNTPLRQKGMKIPAKEIEALQQLDILVPALHGTHGEDGSLQGLCALLHLPIMGCDLLPSAIAMDKGVTKKLAQQAGLRVSPFIEVSKTEWRYQKELVLQRIHEQLHFPLYVKPARLGSTFGVQKVENTDALSVALEDIWPIDAQAIVEEEVIGREIEFALFGSSCIYVFPPGEICTEGHTYTYEAKYGEKSFSVHAQANISEALAQEGMRFAKRAYQAIGANGYARVDCFLDGTGQFILNEINTLPGFTAHSLYPKICAQHGWSIRALLNQLIQVSLERARVCSGISS